MYINIKYITPGFLVYYATVEQDNVGTDNISSIFVSRIEMALAMLVLSVLKSVTDKALVANVFPMSPIVVKVVSPATGHMVFVSWYYGSWNEHIYHDQIDTLVT